MGELLKETFELFCKKKRLKTIDREIRRYNKLNNAAKRTAHIVHELMKKYNELYPDDKIEATKEKL